MTKLTEDWSKKIETDGKVVNKPMTKTKSETKPKVKKPYSVVLELNNKKYKTNGNTLLEAIQLLEPMVGVNNIRTEGLLIASKGNLTAQRKFPNIFKLKRLFTNKTLQIIVAKNLELMME